MPVRTSPFTTSVAQLVPAPRQGRRPDAAWLARRTRALLASHVPLTLLLDLADPLGPDSRSLLVDEPGAVDWLRRS